MLKKILSALFVFVSIPAMADLYSGSLYLLQDKNPEPIHSLRRCTIFTGPMLNEAGLLDLTIINNPPPLPHSIKFAIPAFKSKDPQHLEFYGFQENPNYTEKKGEFPYNYELKLTTTLDGQPIKYEFVDFTGAAGEFRQRRFVCLFTK